MTPGWLSRAAALRGAQPAARFCLERVVFELWIPHGCAPMGWRHRNTPFHHMLPLPRPSHLLKILLSTIHSSWDITLSCEDRQTQTIRLDLVLMDQISQKCPSVAFLGRWCLPIVFGERLVWEHQPFIRNRTQLCLSCPPQGKMCLADTVTVWWMGFLSPQGRMSHLQELQLSRSPGSCGFCWAMLGGKGGLSSLNHGKCPTCKAALLGLYLQWERS